MWLGTSCLGESERFCGSAGRKRQKIGRKMEKWHKNVEEIATRPDRGWSSVEIKQMDVERAPAGVDRASIIVFAPKLMMKAKTYLSGLLDFSGVSDLSAALSDSGFLLLLSSSFPVAPAAGAPTSDLENF